MCFINPSSYVHYLVFYVPLFAQVWEDANEEGVPRPVLQLLLCVVFGVVAMTTEGILGKRTNDLLESFSIPTYGLLLLLIAACGAIRFTRGFSPGAR
jgi:hypothetical protein